MIQDRKWLCTLIWLRREFPLDRAITVRSVSMSKDLYGTTELTHDRFLIFINRKFTFSVKIDTILHEWPHALTWFGADRKEPHSDEWGLAYAKIYRAWIKWDLGRRET